MKLSKDHERRLRLLRVLELTGWTIEYAERMIEERPIVISDMFALERARKRYNEYESEKPK